MKENVIVHGPLADAIEIPREYLERPRNVPVYEPLVLTAPAASPPPKFCTAPPPPPGECVVPCSHCGAQFEIPPNIWRSREVPNAEALYACDPPEQRQERRNLLQQFVRRPLIFVPESGGHRDKAEMDEVTTL